MKKPVVLAVDDNPVNQKVVSVLAERYGYEVVVASSGREALEVLKKGETISVDQIPGTGTVVLVNGKRVGEPFPDETFFNGLLQIWVGPKPIDSSLKPVLLGTEQSNDNSQRNDSKRF